MIHYFISDDSNNRFHDIRMEAWKEDKNVLYTDTQEEASSFTRIEEIRLFSHKDPKTFQSTSFRVDFGQDSATGSSHRNAKDLIEDKTEFDPWSNTTREKYEELRGKVFQIYLKNPHMDFTKITPGGDYSITQLR